MKAIDRFVKKVKILDSGCWEWTGAKIETGYGVFWYQGRSVNAHRWIYEYVHNKQISQDVYICHHCDNTSCVNPSHLFEGTPQDNMSDKVNKGRHTKGVDVNTNKLTEEDVLFIREHRHLKTKYLAEKFGVNIHHINKLKRGLGWKHLNKKGPVKGLSH